MSPLPPPSPPPPPRPWVSPLKVIDDLLATHKPATRRSYDTSLRAWVDWCARERVTILHPTAGECRQYATHIADEGGAAATVHARCGPVRVLIQYAIDNGLREGPNPWRKIKLPQLPRKSTTRSLTRDEQARLYAWCATNATPTTYALVRLMGVLGMRVSEATAFDLRRLEALTDGWRYRYTAKGEVERDIVLDDETVDAINLVPAAQAYRQTRGPHPQPVWLFPGNGGTPIHRATATQRVHEACRGAGVPQISPHGFRHAAITRAWEITGDPRAPMDLAGHTTLASTLRYDRRDDQQADTARAIAQALRDGGSQ